MYKEFLEIVGNGKPTGSVLKETIAVSATISISVQNRHSRILLRALLRGRMTEMHREPEVPEEEVPVEERFDCLATITLKGTCTNSFCEKWHLQNACSTSQKMDADLVKSALMRIARLMSTLANRSKKNGDKSAVALLKITRQLGCVFQDMESRRSLHRFYRRTQTCGNRSDV